MSNVIKPIIIIALSGGIFIKKIIFFLYFSYIIFIYINRWNIRRECLKYGFNSFVQKPISKN